MSGTDEGGPMIYHVSLKAFGSVRDWQYEAESEKQAIQKAHDHAGYSVKVTPMPKLDHTHTGGVVSG
jgi:hypothetical protein